MFIPCSYSLSVGGLIVHVVTCQAGELHVKIVSSGSLPEEDKPVTSSKKTNSPSCFTRKPKTGGVYVCTKRPGQIPSSQTSRTRCASIWMGLRGSRLRRLRSRCGLGRSGTCRGFSVAARSQLGTSTSSLPRKANKSGSWAGSCRWKESPLLVINT